MTAPLIAARTLAVGHRDTVLRDITLDVLPGECWFVVGDNGVGKSTLLLTLLDLLPPRAGVVLRAPVIVDRSGLGYAPQSARYGRALSVTVGELIDCGLQSGLDRRQRRARADAALAAVDLAGVRSLPVGELSTGQQRRVLVARALAREPQLLLLDEPTANLDRRSAEALVETLERQRRERGMAIVHVAHAPWLVRRFATHVLAVGAGRVDAGPVATMLPTLSAVEVAP